MSEFAQKAASRDTAGATTHVVSGRPRLSGDGDGASADAGLGRLRVTLNQSPRVQAAAQLYRSLNHISRPAYPGTPTPKRPPSESRKSGFSSVAQRMIALDIKPNVEMQEDMPALKVLAQLKQFLAAKLSDSDVFLLQEGLDFSKMREGETLYIAGHGTPGSLYGVAPGALLKMLNDPEKGLPAHIGEIVFLVCNAGTLETEEDHGSSLVSQVAMGLRHPKIGVVGAKGYTFGAPRTAERGLNRVMPGSLWAIEKASDEEEIAKELFGMAMTVELRAAAQRSPDANPQKVESASTFGEAFDSNDELVKHSKRFLDRKVQIELQLNQVVGEKQPQQETGATAINSVVGGLKGDDGFGELVKQQNALYDEFGFFYEKDEYDRQTSLGGAAALKDKVAHELFLNSLSWGERMKIGREVSQAYDGEIGRVLGERFLTIVNLSSTVAKEAEGVILAVEGVGQDFLLKYGYAGKQQLEAVAKAKVAFPRMSEIAQSKDAGVVFGLVGELDACRKPIRSLCQYLTENSAYKGVLTYLSENAQTEKSQDIGRMVKSLESNAKLLLGALDVTKLDKELNTWIHHHA